MTPTSVQTSTVRERDRDAELWACQANSFGAEAAAYNEHRPDYPAAAIRWALQSVNGVPEPEVLDLGAGTGKLTGNLLTAGAQVIAVEPDEAMRAEFGRRHPEVPALAGSAEAIPLPDNSFYAVLVGQAFHWFDQQRAFPEIARVLRPGGVFAAFWNTHDITIAWVAELDRLSGCALAYQRRTQHTIPAHPLFRPFERTEFPHTHRRTAESLTATLVTHSHTLMASPQQRAETLTRLTDYLHIRPETRAGEFDLPLRTLAIRSRLPPSVAAGVVMTKFILTAKEYVLLDSGLDLAIVRTLRSTIAQVGALPTIQRVDSSSPSRWVCMEPDCPTSQALPQPFSVNRARYSAGTNNRSSGSGISM
ncbi:methyltransferase domain-containing protein [Nocardia sp. NPDC004278]